MTPFLIVSLSILIVAFGCLGGLMETYAPMTEFPESWLSGLKPIEGFPASRRALAGALFGMVFLATGCDLASANLIGVPATRDLSIATFIQALVAGLVGARMVRMRIRVPILKVVAFLLNGLRACVESANSAQPKPSSARPVVSHRVEASRLTRSRRTKRKAGVTRNRFKDPPFPPTGASPVFG
jgi:hypothetical protein